MPPDEPLQTSDDGLRHYLALLALSFAGPAVLSAYVFAGWSLTAGNRPHAFLPLVRRTAVELDHLAGRGASVNPGYIHAPPE
jgi:hypothetical protein